jgi:hypothetical protein
MLTKEEMLNIYGGAVSWGIVGAIAAGVVFIIGIIDGYLRPLKCR